MISQEQANRASALCERALEIIAKIQRDFDEMKAASGEFQQRMTQTALAPDAGEGEV